MAEHKRSIIVTALLLFAFAWGYKGEDLLAQGKAWATSLFTSESPPSEPAPAPPKTEKLPLPMGSLNPVVQQVPQDIPATPFPGSGMVTIPRQFGPQVASPIPTGAPNLSQTFDSVNRGSIQETQVEQRNLYFEKLREQLRQLQGEATPSPQPNDLGQPPTISPPGPNNLGPGNVQPVPADNPYSQMPGYPAGYPDGAAVEVPPPEGFDPLNEEPEDGVTDQDSADDGPDSDDASNE